MIFSQQCWAALPKAITVVYYAIIVADFDATELNDEENAAVEAGHRPVSGN